MLQTYDYRNLASHNVRHEEVDEVMRSWITIECSMPPSKRGNERVLLIGFTLAGRLLEIGIEFFDDRVHIFHANDATKVHRKEFERRVKP